MGDLVQEVLDEEWQHADRDKIAVSDTHVGGFWENTHDGYGNYRTAERARQAALGHRALRLLAGGNARWSREADEDEECAIITELRGGK